MEPIEASNLDNQYKYYWEGDLCGQASLEDGAVVGARPACGGWAASSFPSGQEHPTPPPHPRTVPPSQDSVGLKEWCGGRLGTAANTKYKQGPQEHLESGILTDTWNLRFSGILRCWTPGRHRLRPTLVWGLAQELLACFTALHL